MKFLQKLAAAAALCAASAALPVAAAQIASSPTIQVLAAQAAHSPARAAGPYDERDWLERFYAPRFYAPAWQPAQAAAALYVLRGARAEGLDPRDYGVDALQRQAAAASTSAGAAFDVALTSAMLHYLADLRVGRVRSEYHTVLPDPRLQAYDPVERLREGLAKGQLQAAVRAAEPPVPLYARTKAALARYRELAALPYPPLPQPPGGKLVAGDRYTGGRALYKRLVLLGDLPEEAPAPPPKLYSPALARAVARFQARHGIKDDGVLGSSTLAALNVPPAVRVRQLELTLERLRWLPDFAPGPLVAVDLPAYRLWAFNVGQDEAPLEMRVVVGTAVKTETPLFVGQMRYLEFNPYWNVPRSILLKEILPKLESNPGYLKQNDMETVPAGASLADLQAGRARVRQRPGPKNSLGAIKFGMPNPMDIYLHSTPAPELFRRIRRDLSHGCIRVEQPAALARFVLGDQQQWDTGHIEQALQPGTTRRVDLRRPLPVVIFYSTASVDRDGKAHFAADIYGRDPLLEHELAAHASQIVPASGAATE
jgi:murein L,D-transpeptidase YcbB/YkuD